MESSLDDGWGCRGIGTADLTMEPCLGCPSRSGCGYVWRHAQESLQASTGLTDVFGRDTVMAAAGGHASKAVYPAGDHQQPLPQPLHELLHGSIRATASCQLFTQLLLLQQHGCASCSRVPQLLLLVVPHVNCSGRLPPSSSHSRVRPRANTSVRPVVACRLSWQCCQTKPSPLRLGQPRKGSTVKSAVPIPVLLQPSSRLLAPWSMMRARRNLVFLGCSIIGCVQTFPGFKSLCFCKNDQQQQQQRQQPNVNMSVSHIERVPVDCDKQG
jgi:hypothetical protein